jgi:hypothetical protein
MWGTYYTGFIVQAYQTSQYVVPCGSIFLGKWHSSFAGSSNGKMNVQSACALNTPYYIYTYLCVCFLAALSGSERLKEVNCRGSETEQAMCKKILAQNREVFLFIRLYSVASNAPTSYSLFPVLPVCDNYLHLFSVSSRWRWASSTY